MIDYELDAEHSILQVQPKSALDKQDFVELAKAVDPQIEATGDLAGLIINAGIPGLGRLRRNGEPLSLRPRPRETHQESRGRYRLAPRGCRRTFGIALCVSEDPALPRRADRTSTTMDYRRLVEREAES